MESNPILTIFFCLFLISSCASDTSVNETTRLDSIFYFDGNNSTVAIRTNPDPNRPLKILVHGFTETKNAINAEGYITDMKNSILKYDPEKPVVMVVNWNTGISYDETIIDLTYRAAKELVNTLISSGINEKYIHCIGHSLGAQMCAFVGQEWIKKRGTKIARISGLDPAGPQFGILTSVPVDKRLDKDDASYVDIYHTNYGIWGINYNAGHSDFWMNGVYGVYQPGCIADTYDGSAVKGFCSHKRSWAYFISSIQNPNCFTKLTDITGFKKLNTKFGYWSNKPFPNVYVKTGSTAPYCQ